MRESLKTTGACILVITLLLGLMSWAQERDACASADCAPAQEPR